MDFRSLARIGVSFDIENAAERDAESFVKIPVADRRSFFGGILNWLLWIIMPMPTSVGGLFVNVSLDIIINCATYVVVTIFLSVTWFRLSKPDARRSLRIVHIVYVGISLILLLLVMVAGRPSGVMAILNGNG